MVASSSWSVTTDSPSFFVVVLVHRCNLWVYMVNCQCPRLQLASLSGKLTIFFKKLCFISWSSKFYFFFSFVILSNVSAWVNSTWAIFFPFSHLYPCDPSISFPVLFCEIPIFCFGLKGENTSFQRLHLYFFYWKIRNGFWQKLHFLNFNASLLFIRILVVFPPLIFLVKRAVIVLKSLVSGFISQDSC